MDPQSKLKNDLFLAFHLFVHFGFIIAASTYMFWAPPQFDWLYVLIFALTVSSWFIFNDCIGSVWEKRAYYPDYDSNPDKYKYINPSFTFYTENEYIGLIVTSVMSVMYLINISFVLTRMKVPIALVIIITVILGVYFVYTRIANYVSIKNTEVFSQPVPSWISSDPILTTILDSKRNTVVDRVHIFTFIGCAFIPKCRLTSTLTWETFEKDVDVLRQAISAQHFDYIIGVASGGAFVAAALSKQTGVPCKYIKIKKYFKAEIKTINHGLNVTVLSDKIEDVHNKKVLVIDDQINTGDTILAAKAFMQKYTADIKLAVLYSTYDRAFLDYQPIRHVLGATPWGYDP